MARFYAPSTIFFDEVDAVFSRRDSGGEGEASKRVQSELLVQMDGVVSDPDKRLIVLAATNRPWDLDEALIRRLEKRICKFKYYLDIGLPSVKARKDLFKLNLKDVKTDSNIDWEGLAKRTNGYSGADIANVCREAAMLPMRKRLKEKVDLSDLAKMQKEFDKPIEMSEMNEALKSITKTVVSQYLNKYEAWMKQFGAT